MEHQISLASAYAPAAVYYDLADSVEYMRRDEMCVYRRIDDNLTLALNLDRSEVIGFRLKGFKNFFLTEMQPLCDLLETDFVSMVAVVEKVALRLADHLGADGFDEERRKAYRCVHQIAQEDGVKLSDLPRAA